MKDRITTKLIVIGLVAVACFVASALVLALVAEREARHYEAGREVGSAWGSAQTVLGPMLTFEYEEAVGDGTTRTRTRTVLPETLSVKSTLLPEVRKRGIYETVVYTQKLVVEGSFTTEGVPLSETVSDPTLSVGLSDTRSIESQVALAWGDERIDFLPGSELQYLNGSGIHTSVPFDTSADEYSFAFELTLRGSESVTFVPVADETDVSVTSLWPSPQFTGAFLPSERTIDESGFSATWQVSSFGRGYPQTWNSDTPVSIEQLVASSFSVRLHEGVDFYTQVERSAKYAVLFIIVTFTVFFLFEVLTKLSIHPIQYLLVGAALALFYLLLLSLSEHVGFLVAYVVATGMVTVLISLYSVSVLKQKGRAGVVAFLLLALYGYLYFVLKLEEYALLFGSLLVFALLALVMFATRKIDWFGFGTHTQSDEDGGIRT